MARFAAIRGSVTALACAAALAACAREPEPTDNTVDPAAGPPPPLTLDSAPSATPAMMPSGPAVDTGAGAARAPEPTTVPASSSEAAAGATTSPVQPATPATAQTDSGHTGH